jgi:hypothetical protein
LDVCWVDDLCKGNPGIVDPAQNCCLDNSDYLFFMTLSRLVLSFEINYWSTLAFALLATILSAVFDIGGRYLHQFTHHALIYTLSIFRRRKTASWESAKGGCQMG